MSAQTNNNRLAFSIAGRNYHYKYPSLRRLADVRRFLTETDLDSRITALTSGQEEVVSPQTREEWTHLLDLMVEDADEYLQDIMNVAPYDMLVIVGGFTPAAGLIPLMPAASGTSSNSSERE